MRPKHEGRLSTTGLEVDLLLGVMSIPFILILTTDPSALSIAPVLVSGFLCGLYYGTRERSVSWAGVRTGLVGGLPVVWSASDLVSSALSVSPDSLAIGVVGASLLVGFFLTISAVLTAACAMLGGFVSRRL
jgi:hypothetical protein